MKLRLNDWDYANIFPNMRERERERERERRGREGGGEKLYLEW